MSMTSVLAIAAHPDDETVMAGGTLAMLASKGVQVHILVATRGEGGEMGDPASPICDRDVLGAVRTAEVQCAGQALGAASVDFLGYIDPVCIVDGEVYAFEADYDLLVHQIREWIARTQAYVVLSHGTDGEYGHPAHKLLNRAVTEAVSGMQQDSPLFYTWAAVVPGIEDRIWNQSDPAQLALDVQPWLGQKAAALDCHRTQHYLFLRRRENATTMMDVARKVEGVRRQIPSATNQEPVDGFAALLRAAGAWVPEFRVGSNSELQNPHS